MRNVLINVLIELIEISYAVLCMKNTILSCIILYAYTPGKDGRCEAVTPFPIPTIIESIRMQSDSGRPCVNFICSYLMSLISPIYSVSKNEQYILHVDLILLKPRDATSTRTQRPATVLNGFIKLLNYCGNMHLISSSLNRISCTGSLFRSRLSKSHST